MAQQVSPAVVVVVLILVLAIVVALYYLVVQHPTAEEGEDVGVPLGPAGEPLAAEGEAEGEAAETPAAPEAQ